MTLLFRHPDTPPGAIHAVDAELQRVPDGAVATFRAIGDPSRLVIPPPADPIRTDELWKTTCFEIFVGDERAPYVEFNLSPSGAWAAYCFDDYRSGMKQATAEIQIQSTLNSKGLTLEAEIKSKFADGARIGLTAVIEEADGMIRYWSTAFAPGKPDFHAPAVRSLLLDGIGTE